MAANVEYFTPKTVKEACSLALKYKEKARFIAGGTDLVIQMKHKEVLPRYIINIGGLGLDYIKYSENTGLKIGGLATIHSVATSPIVKEKFTLLAEAASQLGSNQIRQVATVAGNLVHAAPSAETACPLLVLSAKVKLVGTEKSRTVPLEKFFKGPGKTVARKDEILAEIQIPNPLPHTGSAYIKHSLRKAMDLAAVGVAALVTMNGNTIIDAKIALGAVAPTPMRSPGCERILKGKTISDELLKEAGQCAAVECRPIDDIRAGADYRRDMINVNTVRALQQAIERARKS